MAEHTTAMEGTPGMEEAPPKEEVTPVRAPEEVRPERVTRIKDPKRVAAGRAGAEARKRKQQAILNDLQQLKATVAERPAEPRGTHSMEPPTPSAPQHKPRPPSDGTSAAQLLMLAGAAVVLAGIVWKVKGGVSLAGDTPAARLSSTAHPLPAPELKMSAHGSHRLDPHLME